MAKKPVRSTVIIENSEFSKNAGDGISMEGPIDAQIRNTTSRENGGSGLRQRPSPISIGTLEVDNCGFGVLGSGVEIDKAKISNTGVAVKGSGPTPAAEPTPRPKWHERPLGVIATGLAITILGGAALYFLGLV